MFEGFGAIEWIAFILALAGIIKIFALVMCRDFWIRNVTTRVYGSRLTAWVFLILGVVVFYYLLQSLSIIQIFAVMGFTSLFVALAFIIYGVDLRAIAKKSARQSFSLAGWIYLLVWLALSVWVLVELF